MQWLERPSHLTLICPKTATKIQAEKLTIGLTVLDQKTKKYIIYTLGMNRKNWVSGNGI